MKKAAYLSPMVFALALLMLPAAVASGDDDAAKEDQSAAEQIKGEWVIYRDTPDGRFMTIKEHDGKRTLLTTYNPNKVAVYSHRSHYRVDESGDVCIFRYGNKKVLIGDGAGKVDETESAYLFRVENDQFIELHGMMKGDSGKPSLVIWERLKENPIPKPKT